LRSIANDSPELLT